MHFFSMPISQIIISTDSLAVTSAMPMQGAVWAAQAVGASSTLIMEGAWKQSTSHTRTYSSSLGRSLVCRTRTVDIFFVQYDLKLQMTYFVCKTPASEDELEVLILNISCCCQFGMHCDSKQYFVTAKVAHHCRCKISNHCGKIAKQNQSACSVWHVWFCIPSTLSPPPRAHLCLIGTEKGSNTRISWVNLSRIFIEIDWRYGASLGGPLCYTHNPTFGLFSCTFWHTMSLWRHESIHNNTSNQQTPPPWWWSHSPHQWHGFDKTTPSEWWATLLMLVLRLLSKGFIKINKLQ